MAFFHRLSSNLHLELKNQAPSEILTASATAIVVVVVVVTIVTSGLVQRKFQVTLVQQ